MGVSQSDRPTLCPRLACEAGPISGRAGNPCNEQAFDPGVLIARALKTTAGLPTGRHYVSAHTSPVPRASLQSSSQSSSQSSPQANTHDGQAGAARAASSEPRLAPRLAPDIVQTLAGTRFSSMVASCPVVSAGLSVACCGNASIFRRACGSPRRQQQACTRAWAALQPLVEALNRTALLAGLDERTRRWVKWWDRRGSRRPFPNNHVWTEAGCRKGRC